MKVVYRDILSKINPWLPDPQIILIKGARRAGKTTLLKIIEKNLAKNKAPTKYISVDQHMYEPFWKSLDSFEMYLKTELEFPARKRLYLFLDEVQYLDDPGLFLKTLYDKYVKEIKLIVTGSSSLELLKTREFLPGRKVEFTLERFSFLEFCRTTFMERKQEMRFSEENWDDLTVFYKTFKTRLEGAFLEYITWGGYPEVVLQNQRGKKLQLLESILNTYLEKDVSSFFNISNISGYNNLVQLLTSQIGQLINKKEISSTLGLHYNTVNTYLDILSGTFMFDFVRPFFTNVRKELSKMPKVYVRDLGIVRYALSKNFMKYELIDGHLVENFVYRHLLEDYAPGDIHFYRTRGGTEVDFVLGRRGAAVIEVKFSKRISKIPRSVKRFLENYGNNVNRIVIVTMDKLAKEGDVYYVPGPLFPFFKFSA